MLSLQIKSIASYLNSLVFISILSSPLAWLLEILSSWHMENSTYVSYVTGAVIIDHLVGSIYHKFWVADFKLKKNLSGLMVKLIAVVSAGYLFEGLDALMDQQSIIKDYTIMVLHLMVFIYPASSAWGNIYVMTGRKFPPVGFMDKIEKLNKHLTINGKIEKDEDSKNI